MTFLQNIVSYFHRYFSISSISAIDIIEMLIIAVIFYYILIWAKKTSAWTLFKGIFVVLIIMLLAAIFNFSTILWITTKILSIGVIALIIIFQPELRRALEQLGRRKIFNRFWNLNSREQRFSDNVLEELIKSVKTLSERKVGALICIEDGVSLLEYINTGIFMDAAISNQLILNIFEDKTPLHDGAVIIRDDRITAATCYLPLSSTRSLNKKYGTRHRAALGISEVSDAFTIVVSEETGEIAMAISGNLIENVSINDVRERLVAVQNKQNASNWFDRFRRGVKVNEVSDKAEGNSSEIRTK